MMNQQGETHRCAPYWHMDCLGTVAILALAFNRRQRKRLSGRYGITVDADSADPVTIYCDLHEACHCHQPLVKAIGKELDSRFGEVVRKVSSADLETIGRMEAPFPLPLLWATLSDSREEVRLEGRRRLHELLLQAFRLSRTVREKQEDSADVTRVLSQENAGLKARIGDLERELRHAHRTLETARPARAAATRPALPEAAVSPGIVARLEREVRKLTHELSGGASGRRGSKASCGPSRAGKAGSRPRASGRQPVPRRLEQLSSKDSKSSPLGLQPAAIPSSARGTCCVPTGMAAPGTAL